MIDPLMTHTLFINANSIQTEISWLSACPDPRQKNNAARITEIIEKQYMHGRLRDFCNKQLQFGMLNSSVHIFAFIRSAAIPRIRSSRNN